MRSEPLQQQAAAQRKGAAPCPLSWALRVSDTTPSAFSAFQKGAGDVTIALFLFPGPGDNICVSCYAPTSLLAQMFWLQIKKKQMVNCKGAMSIIEWQLSRHWCNREKMHVWCFFSLSTQTHHPVFWVYSSWYYNHLPVNPGTLWWMRWKQHKDTNSRFTHENNLYINML